MVREERDSVSVCVVRDVSKVSNVVPTGCRRRGKLSTHTVPGLVVKRVSFRKLRKSGNHQGTGLDVIVNDIWKYS